MSLIVLLAVLALEHYWPRQPSARPGTTLLALTVRWTESLPSFWAKAAPVLLLLIILWLTAWIERWLGSASGLLLFVFHVAILRACMAFVRDREQYLAIVQALRAGNEAMAQQLAERWSQTQVLPVPERKPAEVTPLGSVVLCQAIWVVYLHLLVPLSLYLLLPGVIGPTLWLILLSWARSPEWGGPSMTWIRALESGVAAALARISALAFAIAGHFEEAVYGWKRRAWDWPERHHGILMESALGALGYSAYSGSSATVAPLGAASAPPQNNGFELQPIEGFISLMWRVLALYTAIFALISFTSAFA